MSVKPPLCRIPVDHRFHARCCWCKTSTKLGTILVRIDARRKTSPMVEHRICVNCLRHRASGDTLHVLRHLLFDIKPPAEQTSMSL